MHLDPIVLPCFDLAAADAFEGGWLSLDARRAGVLA